MTISVKPISDLAAQFGATLHALRKQQGLNQEQLAQAAGYSRAMIASLETGNSLPSLEKLFALAQALGVEPACLLGAPLTAGRAVPPPVLVEWRRWTAQERQAVVRYLQLLVAELEEVASPA